MLIALHLYYIKPFNAANVSSLGIFLMPQAAPQIPSLDSHSLSYPGCPCRWPVLGYSLYVPISGGSLDTFFLEYKALSVAKVQTDV